VAYAGISAPQSYTMVADGVKSPPYRAIDFEQTLLNGKRLVYVAQTADQLWHAVVDGKPGPGYVSITSLKLTPDGAHYGYLAIRAGGGGPGLPMLAVAVVDGVESKAYHRIDGALELAPDGRAAYVAATKPGEGYLVVGGQDIPGSCGPPPLVTCVAFGTRPPGSGAGPSPQAYVAFSPDGKGFAYIRTNRPNPGVTVIANGKPMGPTYTQAHYLLWSADGSRFAYVGNSPTGWFPVVDGEELSGYSSILDFQFSPDGKRYAFVGHDAAKGQSVVVDGKEQTKPGSEVGSLRFSPDGKHVVFAARATVQAYQPILDGVAKPHNLGNFFSVTRHPLQLTFPQFLFSADGTHLAYVAVALDGTGKASVYVDGTVYQGPTPSYTYPSFSPDGKHFATVVTTGKGWGVMVDGKMSPLYDDVVMKNAASCRFVNDHAFRFYGIKAGQVYRVTLDLS
jgi:dipeptidyl aminopeptidase/acylaminoacyl peptidase